MEKLLTVDEVAKFLRFSKQGVYQLVFRKKIPAVKISKRALRFRESDILRWLGTKSATETDSSSRQTSTKRKRR